MDTQKRKIILGALLVIGMVSFLFIMTNTAMSYSDNAKFCLMCHSMDQAYQSLQHSNHKQFKCTECHAPHALGPKWAYKTKSGLRDLYVTAIGEVPVVVKATEESKNVIKENCIRCHQTTVEQTDMGEGRYCIDCHRNLPHEKISGI